MATSRLSYIHQPVTFQYMYETVTDRLRILAEEDPDREAFVFYGYDQKRQSLTRKEILDLSTNTAKHLILSGVKKGTHVAVCMSNSIEMLVAIIGVTLAGGIPFFSPGNLKDGTDLIDMMNTLNGEFLIIDASKGDDNWNIIENIWPRSEKSSEKVPSLKMILFNGTGPLDSGLTSSTLQSLRDFFKEPVSSTDVNMPVLQPEDHLAYFCTSGSTGAPKTVTYTHFGTLNWTKSCDITMNISAESRMFLDRTFSWVVGYPRTYLTEGTTRIFVDNRMTLAGKHTEFLCNIIERERCDVVFLPGYIARDVINMPSLVDNFKNVKHIYMGGERMKKVFYDSLIGKYCKYLSTLYGLTEMGGSLVYSNTTSPFEDGIVGKPVQGMELKIINSDGAVVQTGEQGEICLRSVWRLVAYHGMEQQFRQTVDNENWLHTGDIGHLRDDGNVIVHGRYKEWISSGTNKFFPWMIENVLGTMPGVAQVFAVGVPDPRLGQVVCACVMPKPDMRLTEEDLKTFCDGKFLTESTALGISCKPRYHFIMDSIPLLGSGKIDRIKIGAMAKERFGL
ncbi:hypothetical protein ACF0H5_019756 [Mactra antiquata]